MDNVPFASALICLLRDSCREAGLPKFTDLLMKCIWRNVKMLPERTDELDYDAVLWEVHQFLVTLPSSWWQTRPSDTPLRTVKTIIHNMVKIKGVGIVNHLNKIPSNSELRAYLIKIIRVNIHISMTCAILFYLFIFFCLDISKRRFSSFQQRYSEWKTCIKSSSGNYVSYI